MSEKVRHIFRLWIQSPTLLSPRLRWLYGAGSVAYPAAWSVHAFLVGLYLYWSCPLMVAVNVASLAIWLLGLILLRNRHFTISLLLVYTEVLVQSILSVYYVGLDFGFQFYLLPMTAGMFLIPLRKRLQILLVTLLGVVFLALSFWDPTPFLAVDPMVLKFYFSLNLLVGAFGLSALIHMFYIYLAEQAEMALEAEHARSEKLLHSILPEAISHRLKSAETIADGLESASILFADIVDFSGISRSMTPIALLTMLNSIFSDLDDLVDQFGLEKIKTIGDAYMVASGVPIASTDHAVRLADFALSMRELLKKKALELNIPLQMRIGIHSGSVVAGIIGHKRYQYDLWGETVNTASRMESHGLPSEIQVTQETAQLLSEYFELKVRGIVDVKGKGPITTWLLQGRKPKSNHS